MLMFDGNIMNWWSFREEYEVSLHSRSRLTHGKKPAYLQQALKDGPAQHVIAGLLGSGEQFCGSNRVFSDVL